MELIDVPRHRILKLTVSELAHEFEWPIIDDNGRVIVPYYRRLSDNKLFREPRWHRYSDDSGKIVYLEEYDEKSGLP